MPRRVEAVAVACDLEGYSRLPSLAQERAFLGLQQVVREHFGLGSNERPPAATPVIPTGDGLIACFLVIDDLDVEVASVLSSALQLSAALFEWAHANRVLLRGRGISIGVSGRYVRRVRDINGNDNVCGEAINLAARVQAGARPSTLLIQRDLWNDVVGNGEPMKLQVAGVERTLSCSGRLLVEAKHEVEIPVYRVGCEPEIAGWLRAPAPQARRHVYLTYPRSLSADGAKLRDAVVEELVACGVEKILHPPVASHEQTLRSLLKQADAVIALVVGYDRAAGSPRVKPTSAWIMNTIGAARSGVAPPRPTLVLAQKGVDNFGWGTLKAMGPDAKYDPRHAADIARARHKVREFIEEPDSRDCA